MGLLCSYTCSTLYIPPAEHSINATTNQHCSVWTPDHTHRHRRMPWQFGEECAIEAIPEDHTAIVATAGQTRPVRAPRHMTNHGWLPMTNPEAATCAHIPHLGLP